MSLQCSVVELETGFYLYGDNGKQMGWLPKSEGWTLSMAETAASVAERAWELGRGRY